MTITAEDMICSLAGMCNHASTTDGAGFSRMDADFGHSLAQWASPYGIHGPSHTKGPWKSLRNGKSSSPSS